MSKPLAFNKSTTSTVNTVASTDAITDSTGNSLTSIITTLVNANTTEDLLIQNAPSLSGNNTFTGTTNTFNNPIRYDSSIGVGSLSNSKHLITKEYADGGISGLLATNNTWSGTNTFNAGALQLGKSDNSTVVNLAGTVTVPSGGSLALNAPTTCNNTLTVSNAFTASSSGISLSMVPTLQGNYSQPTGNALATKAYVDGLTAALPDTIQYGQTTTVRLNGSVYTVEAPYLGTSTTANSTGTYITFYINFPVTYTGTPTYTVLQNCVTLDLNYWWYQNLAMTSSTGSSNNWAYFATNRTNANLTLSTGRAGMNNLVASFHVSIRNGALLVYAPVQPTAIWTNPTLTSGTQGPIQFTNSYSASNTAMRYYPINFTYVNDQKIKVEIGYPNQENNPTKSWWISNLGFTAKLTGSMPGTTDNFPQGNPLLTPNSGTNTNSGAAWISTS
jgi:hypothetical protein